MIRLTFLLCIIFGLVCLLFLMLSSTEENKIFLRRIMYAFSTALLLMALIFVISLQEVKTILEILKDLF